VNLITVTTRHLAAMLPSGYVPPVVPVPVRAPDARELILTRLQQTLAALRPGLALPNVGHWPHRTVTTNLGGRCYTRIRPGVRLDETECPFVEIQHDYNGAEQLTTLDEDMSMGEMRLALWGFEKADDQGDTLDSRLRPKLNALRADLIMAACAFPYWPSPEDPESLHQTLGRGVSVRLTSQWTEPDQDSPQGFTVIELTVRYPQNRHGSLGH